MLDNKKPFLWKITFLIIALFAIVVIIITKTNSREQISNEINNIKNTTSTIEANSEIENAENPVSSTKPILEIGDFFDKIPLNEVQLPFPSIDDFDIGKDYNIPNFVEPEEFDWGEYLPVLKFETKEGEAGNFSYAVITPQTTDLDDGINSYFLYKNPVKSIFDLGVFTELQLVQDIPSDQSKREVYSYNSNGGYTLEGDKNKNCFSVFSPNGKCIYKVTKKDSSNAERGNFYLTVEQLLNGRYLLISAFYGARIGYYNRDAYTTQIFDLETEEYTYILSDAKNAIMSPDGKYLAYTLPTVEETLSNGNKHFKTNGFYVLNIETGETLYFRYPIYEGEYSFINWIPRKEYETVVPNTALKADLDEVSQEFLNKYVYLDSKDENTIVRSISFPNDFPYSPYSEDNIVPSNEFDWGGWALLGNHVVGNFTNSDTISDYVIMSENTADIEQAISLYHSYNDKYLIKSPITKNDNLTPLKTRFLYDSRIVYISEDGSSVLRRTRTNNAALGGETEWYHQWLDGMWSDNYELIKNGISLDYVSIESTLYDINSYDDLFKEYPYIYYLQPIEYSDFSSSVYGELVTFEYHDKLLIYSAISKKLLYEITIPYENKTEDGKVKDILLDKILDSRYLLLDVSIHSKGNYYDSNFCLYRYDLKTGEMTFLAQYSSSEYLISPDGKYLAYTSPMGYDYDLDWDKNNLNAMKAGFYIRNLENGEIVAFHDQCSWQNIIGFINAEQILKTSESNVSYVDPSIEQRKDVSFLPKDEQTVSHSLDSSNKIGTTEVDKVRVSNTQFAWGKYIPFVRYLEDNYSSIYSRAFLYSEAKDMSEAQELYQSFNKKMQLSNEYESKIAYVSNEADKVGIFTHVKEDTEWNFEYQVFEKNGEKLFYQKLGKSSTKKESPFYDYSKEAFVPYVLYTTPEECYEIGDHSDDKYKLYYNSDYTKLFVFSVEKKTMLYELSLPVSDDDYVYVMDFSGGRHLLLITLSGDKIAYDLENGSYITINGLGNYPEISPDGKYVLSVADGYGGDNEDALHGFYICNLQTNETVYYHARTESTKYYQYGNFINWVNEEKLLELINDPPKISSQNNTANQ